MKAKSTFYFEKLFEEIPEAIVLTDGHGLVTKVNREFTRLFGYLPEEAAGRHIDDLVAPQAYRSEATGITAAVARGENYTVEAVRQRKDGSLVHVSLLGVPIQNPDGGTGVFGIYRDISARKQAEQALQESRRQLEEAYTQLELISNLDGLTAIPNRRYFERFYDLEWRRRRREQKPIALIMLDIDFFKAYNDNYGHLAGDKCLKQVAHSLQVVNRAGDLVARFGGEEFVAVLSGTSLADACALAERMRLRVKDQAIPHEHSSVAREVTISLGVAALVPDGDTDPATLLLKADQALYLAKSRGRDRVEILDS
jgi:diguanylate cyclase (GGDEF)-like protein/PAS domain S-box-containing protein